MIESKSDIKDLKNGSRSTQLSTKLESDIDKPGRWLSSGRMLCERLSCSNGELNALGPPTQDPRSRVNDSRVQMGN